MFFAGEPTPRARWLSEITREAMLEGIKQCGPGVPINAIGKVSSLVMRSLNKIKTFTGWQLLLNLVSCDHGNCFLNHA